jgi:signal transduction histidine kinase
LSGEVIRRRHTVYFPDTLNLPPGLVALRQGGVPTRSYLGVPLLLETHIVGILSIQSHQPEAYTADQVFLLESLSRQVVVAIQNSRLYQQAQQELAERERAEHQIRLLNETLEERVEERTCELREAQDQLVRQERLAVLGRLSGGIAHELRNPLGVISNAVYFLELILQDADPKITEYLEILKFESQAATRLTSDLLNFSALQPGERQPVAVVNLVERTLKRIPVPAQVSVLRNISPELPCALADPDQVEQILGNFVENAYQAMPEGGTLTVSAGFQAGRVVVAVQDTGVGIPPENMKRLFEPLFSTKLRGIGLGLVISQKLAEANGGQIEVESEPGRGATFRLFLPSQPA